MTLVGSDYDALGVRRAQAAGAQKGRAPSGPGYGDARDPCDFHARVHDHAPARDVGHLAHDSSVKELLTLVTTVMHRAELAWLL